jgi:rod shape-determining protein MreC
MLRNHFRLFLALVVISVTLMMYQSRQGPVRPLWFLSLAIDNINISLTAARDVWRSSFKKLTLRETELMELRQEVRRLKLRELRYRDMAEKNQTLRKILGLGMAYAPKAVVAEVIAKGNDRFSSTLVINKGTIDGVEKDMPVITPDGLLGKIYHSDTRSSVVMLLDDTLFSVAVRLQEKRTEGILTGDGQGRCTLKYVGVDQEVSPGDLLITSGLDRLYPQGIPVASVTKITTPQNELFHIIEAVPIVELRRVEEVVVLTP